MSERDNVVRLVDMAQVDAEAARWIARLDAGEASLEEHALFAAWKAENRYNQEAADRLAGLWTDMNDLDALGGPMALPAPRRRPFAPTGGPRRTSVWAIAGAAAAAILIAVLGLTFFLPTTVAPRTQVYATAVGEQRTVNLEDGSSVQLNTNSRVEVRFSTSARDLRLSRGEAFFEVAANRNRPFSVYAGDGVVRAVGTAFVVRLRERRMEVTVTKGVVDVGRLDRAAPAVDLGGVGRLGRHSVAIVAAQPAATETAFLDRDTITRSVITPPEVTRRLAWREGMLVFTGEALPEVVADVSRYTDMDIEIADSRLAELRVGGYFKVGEVEPMLQALQTSFGVRVERIDARHVRLSRAS